MLEWGVVESQTYLGCAATLDCVADSGTVYRESEWGKLAPPIFGRWSILGVPQDCVIVPSLGPQ